MPRNANNVILKKFIQQQKEETKTNDGVLSQVLRI